MVRSGKESLFKVPYYDQVFNSRPMHEYLSCYWLARVVKRLASGYPDRAYAKWLVLNALWSRIGSELRNRRFAEVFREKCERGRWDSNLDKAVEHLYLASLAFYRHSNRGRGKTAVDVSNFFYRAYRGDLVEGFGIFWRSQANKRRAVVAERLRRFVSDLSSDQ